MHVAVAIVGFRNVHDIVRCVRALEMSDYQNFQVVICENGGREAFSGLKENIPLSLPNGQIVRLIEAPGNGGFASGVNICIAESSDADAWWILNPDTEPSQGSMAALVDGLRGGNDAVGGVLHFPNGLIQNCGGKWRSWFARTVAIGNGEPVEAVPNQSVVELEQMFLSGASMMVSRKFIEIVGLMSEEFFLYCEEIDWCLNARAVGMRLGFAPSALVLHHQGTTTGYHSDVKTRSHVSVYLDERNKMLLTRRHFPLQLPVAAVAALLLIGMRYLRRGAVRQFGYGISGWQAGLRGKNGPPPWLKLAPR